MNSMECITTQIYKCRLCGYITYNKPFNFPECPACNNNKTFQSGGTKKEANHERQNR